MATVQIHQFFSHVGGSHEPFVGEPADCGYQHRDDGNWIDFNGNTGEIRSWDADPESDSATLRTAYCGADNLIRTEANYKSAVAFLTEEIGLNKAEAKRCVESWFTSDSDESEDSDN